LVFIARPTSFRRPLSFRRFDFDQNRCRLGHAERATELLCLIVWQVQRAISTLKRRRLELVLRKSAA